MIKNLLQKKRKKNINEGAKVVWRKLTKSKKLGASDTLTMAAIFVALVVLIAWPALKTIITNLTTNMQTWQTANWVKIFTNLP